MDALPPPSPLQAACITQAASAYGVDPALVRRELQSRGGRTAEVFQNPDGTYEVGLMRIPSAALPVLERYGITRDRLLKEECLNIQVATYMMALRPSPPAASPVKAAGGGLRPIPDQAAPAAPAPVSTQRSVAAPASSSREACMLRGAQMYRLPIELLRAVALTEGGETGTVSRNRNGSVDMGVMQVNSVHLSSAPHNFKARGITAQQLINDDCVNIAAGASILRYEIDRAANFWSGVAHYHSKSPYYASIYLAKVVRHLRAMGVGDAGTVSRAAP